MKEIRFRAWVNERDAWELEDHEKSEDFMIDLDSYSIDTVHTSNGDEIDTKFCKVMQFTGLKDKNGKEIYEGDIIKYIDASYSNNKQIGVVSDYGYMRIYIKAIGGDDEGNQDLELHQDYIYQVIGNIYENPELLEVKE